jgi:hypothetical protein
MARTRTDLCSWKENPMRGPLGLSALVLLMFATPAMAGIRVEISAINEDTFEETKTHTNLTGGFTWRLGSGK